MVAPDSVLLDSCGLASFYSLHDSSIDVTFIMQVASATGIMAVPFNVTISSPRLWSPSNPFLYDVRVRVLSQTAATPPSTVASRKAMPFIAQV